MQSLFTMIPTNSSDKHMPTCTQAQADMAPIWTH